MPNSKVFVSNKGVHDYTNAKQYGELVFVTEGRINPHDTSHMYFAFDQALKKSQPSDYLLLTGTAVLNAVGAALFVALHGRLNLLIFRRDLTYVVRQINYGDAFKHWAG